MFYGYAHMCVQLIALMVIRKLMDFGFTQSDLYWLDHLLPDEARRRKEDEAVHKTQVGYCWLDTDTKNSRREN